MPTNLIERQCRLLIHPAMAPDRTLDASHINHLDGSGGGGETNVRAVRLFDFAASSFFFSVCRPSVSLLPPSYSSVGVQRSRWTDNGETH